MGHLCKVTVKSLESQYYVIAAYKNGPWSWTMDTITLPVGPVVEFDGIQTRWMGEAKSPKAALYRPLTGALQARPIV
jgi:hypothetical protein